MKRPVGVKGGQEDSPALYGVQPVFGQRERARARRGKRVDHAHLDEIEFLLRPREPAFSLVDKQTDARQPGDAGVGPQLARIGQKIDEDGGSALPR